MINRKLSLRQTIIKIVILFLSIIIISKLLESYSNHVDLSKQLLAPSISHPFGTDMFGRDVLARSICGFSNALLIAILAYTISFIIGLMLGVILAYKAGIIDEVFYHLSNLVFSFPSFILASYLASVVDGGLLTLVFLISLHGSFYNAKIVRAQIFSILKEDYITDLKLLGASDSYIIFNHLVREGFLLLLPTMPLMIGHTILTISSFSFLGFGIKPPNADIGLMLQENFTILSIAPWTCILPGLFQVIFIGIMCKNGESIRKYMRYEDEKYDK